MNDRPVGLQSQKNQPNQGFATEGTENTECGKPGFLSVLCDLCGKIVFRFGDFAILLERQALTLEETP